MKSLFISGSLVIGAPLDLFSEQSVAGRSGQWVSYRVGNFLGTLGRRLPKPIPQITFAAVPFFKLFLFVVPSDRWICRVELDWVIKGISSEQSDIQYWCFRNRLYRMHLSSFLRWKKQPWVELGRMWICSNSKTWDSLLGERIWVVLWFFGRRTARQL